MQKIFNGPFHEEMTFCLCDISTSITFISALDLERDNKDLYICFDYITTHFFCCWQLPTYLDKLTTNTSVQLQTNFVSLGVKRKIKSHERKLNLVKKASFGMVLF